MPRGVVDYFHKTSGYGFITSEETSSDVFFHMTEVGDEDPEPDQVVRFSYKHTHKGLRATSLDLDTEQDIEHNEPNNKSWTDTINKNLPDSVPNAPNISIEYGEITDKQPIAGGGNADIMRATLPGHDSNLMIAVKKPRINGALAMSTVEGMLEEAKLWSKIDDHDHIVDVVDYDGKPIPWIALEYMDGGHLGERCGEMETAEALWTAVVITEAVYYAHRQNIAHLDLKPENILFRSIDRSWDVPKVSDWGLSKYLHQHSKSIEALSVEYAAPEQFDDEYGHTDDLTDIYQLGAVFYDLFTGRPPFEGQPFKIMNKIKSDRPTPPSEISDVPEGLDDILMRALAKEKADRYDDIVYLRDDLQQLFTRL